MKLVDSLSDIPVNISAFLSPSGGKETVTEPSSSAGNSR